MTRKFGFTLAEVLITLAIIGIVAAMTIPTLIANYQERSWNTAATVFDRKLTEAGSAKFFVQSNGETVVANNGVLTEREIRVLQEFIKDNYREMYLKWAEKSEKGFFGE